MLLIGLAEKKGKLDTEYFPGNSTMGQRLVSPFKSLAGQEVAKLYTDEFTSVQPQSVCIPSRVTLSMSGDQNKPNH